MVDLMEAATGAGPTLNLRLDPGMPHRSPVVLVVDDSLTTRTLEKNILEAAGYQVRLATDGLAALQMLDDLADDGGCDLLLSDIDMPQLNGFELTAQVRAGARFKHVPIVLVTSLDTPADRERGIAAGADAYIVKRTFEQQALLETIARLI
jgi:two-component system chemotaxis sensor kinase CheA